MKRLIGKFIVFVSACVVLYTLAGFIFAPLLLKPFLTGKLSRYLQCPVSIENVRINPYLLTVSIEDLVVEGKNGAGRIASVAGLYADLRVESLSEKALLFNELRVEKPFIRITRDREGHVHFLPAGEEKAEVERVRESEGKGGASVPVIRFGSIDVSGGSILFSDASLHSVTDPTEITIKNLRLKGKNISTAPGSRGEIALTFKDEQAGSVSVGGPLGVNPVSADLQVTVSDCRVLPFRAYLLDITKIIIEDGKIAATGNISIDSSADGTITTVYNGTATVSDFSSVDEVTKDRFAACEKADFLNIAVGYNPGFLTIDSIAFSNFYVGLTVNPDKTINITDLSKKVEVKEEETTEKRAEKPSRKAFDPFIIRELRFENGHVRLTDNVIKPAYSTDITGVEGKISGLCSTDPRGARVELRGDVDKTAPLEITGEIDLFSDDLFMDMTMSLRNKDASRLTPYFRKYLGYAVDKGKMTLDLGYKIEGNLLTSRNRISFDQLSLGEKVNSPDALDLPVALSVSLLKDSGGKINLDVPVTGRLDDPEFSSGYFVMKIVGNVLGRALTAPFELVGAIFDGSEEVSYVAFDYGSSAITERGGEKLDALVVRLHKKPALKLGIEGYADIDRDMEQLKKIALEKKLKSAKYDYLLKKGEKSPPVEKIVVEPGEYREYLGMIYAAERKEAEDITTDLPTDQLEQSILRGIVLDEGDVRNLAYERALRARDYILDSGMVKKERIFLLEPRSLQGKSAEDSKGSGIKMYVK